MMIKSVLPIVSLTYITSTDAFVVAPTPSTSGSATSTSLYARFNDVSGVGYTKTISKPLGVIFGENPEPALGLKVDDVSEGQNGAVAGLRVGDQLIAVNGESVVGEDFDSVMNLLISSPGQVQVQLYRGNTGSLFELLYNLKGPPVEEEPVEFVDTADESYVPPKIEVQEEDLEPLTPADYMRGIGKAFSMVTENIAPKGEEKQEKKGGFFGGLFNAETVQLEGDEATGLKGVPKERNQK